MSSGHCRSGPIFHTGEIHSSKWSTAWLIMKCLNSAIGGKATGMTNGLNYSRYGRQRRDFILEDLWRHLLEPAEPVDAYDGPRTGKRQGQGRWVLFGTKFTLTSGFENICGNAVRGGIDLSGIFPRYINIQRSAPITFMAVWIVELW
ncbi:hypothetical protein B0H10DRAFT_2220247 [Mycena sp. CBHHK59/15]|nr:hypothetical protein B0H10DRAFT_2220247 [Mycena sp. CBHHK59/15]